MRGHKKDRTPRSSLVCKEMAGGLGFEPRLEESESSVLPLDDPPVLVYTIPHRREKSSAFLQFPAAQKCNSK